MYKYVVICGLTCLMTVIAVWAAEPYTGFLNSGANNTTAPNTFSGTNSTLPSVSAEEFKKRVDAAGQANQQNIANQLKQEYSKYQTLPPYKPPAGIAPSPSTTTTTPTAPQQTPARETARTTNPSTTTSSPPTSTQVYTGFGSGTGNAPASSGGNNNSSGGWNVQY